MTSAALLVLADGRFPSGGHAHSHGAEAAIGLGDVRTLADLEVFLHRRLASTGRVDAAFAAAACARNGAWAELESEYAARTASPVLRAASRALGRQLLRAGEIVWPTVRQCGIRAESGADGPFHPIALGAVGAAADLRPRDIALVSLHHLAGGVTTAAVRLLGLDPFAVAAISARTAHKIDALTDETTRYSDGPIAALPARVDPTADVLAEHHATWEVRLFAS